MLILPVPVPAVVVNPDGTALLNAVVVALVMANVPALKVMFFVPVAVTNVGAVRVKPPRLSVPSLIVYAPVALFVPCVRVPLVCVKARAVERFFSVTVPVEEKVVALFVIRNQTELVLYYINTV